MQQIDLIGRPSDVYNILKAKLEEYLVNSKLDCSLNEHYSQIISGTSEARDTIIEAMGHTFIFKTESDISNKLSKLFLLLESAQSGISSKEKKCINCDHCRCQKSLDTTS